MTRRGGRTWLGRAARRAAAWAAMALLASASPGCGAADDSTETPDGAVFPDAGVCQYAVTVTPFQPLLGDPVSLEVTSTGACVPEAGSYQWSITGPGGAVLEPSLRQAGRIAEVATSAPGTHHVEVTFTDFRRGTQQLQRTVLVTDPGAEQQGYLLRLTPPAGVHAPRQQQLLVVYGATAVEDRILTLDEGLTVGNQLAGPQGPIGGYLRLTEAGFSMVKEVRVPASGIFEVAVIPETLYGVTVVPEGSVPAPARFPPRNVNELLAPEAFTLDTGYAVVGYVTDASGLPVGEARAMLRADGLPSSVGQSEPFDGRFVIWARPGDHALEVAPPEGTPLPDLRVPAGSGLGLVPDAALELGVRYRPIQVIAVEAVVRAPGDVPVSGARVTFEATDLGAAATVTATLEGSPVATVDASGGFRRSVTSDAFGQLPPLALPAGTYQVLVELPAGGPAGVGTTLLQGVRIDAAVAEPLVLLARTPATLEGWVVDELLDPVPDVEVVAVTGLGIGSAALGRTDADGAFRLEVVGGAPYSVLLAPESGGDLARRRLDGVRPAAMGATLLEGNGPGGEVVLPRGLRLSGTVVFQTDGLGGVLVQAIPADRPEAPVLAETVTDPAGAFELVVPDPGVTE